VDIRKLDDDLESAGAVVPSKINTLDRLSWWHEFLSRFWLDHFTNLLDPYTPTVQELVLVLVLFLMRSFIIFI
jgi:hypothetical protein